MAIGWIPTEVLEKLLTDAITQVASREHPPSILAHTIIVAIQTEVGKAKEEILTHMVMAMREVSK